VFLHTDFRKKYEQEVLARMWTRDDEWYKHATEFYIEHTEAIRAAEGGTDGGDAVWMHPQADLRTLLSRMRVLCA
jgi:hypothetical protein